jgi:hypothetical protein
MMAGPYLNDSGYEVPDNKIIIVPQSLNDDGWYKEIIKPLKGETKRNWFNSHFYYCLPLSIGNQYGFVINSLRDFDVVWDGTDSDAKIIFLNNENEEKQIIKNGFGKGIITIQNRFSLKTPIGINLMTIQPPNLFIPGCAAMTGVIETDQIRRDFTFNLKVTVPNIKITIKKGDPVGAFIPIPRYFVDNFEVELVGDLFDEQLHINEIEEMNILSIERMGKDKEKPHQSGRRYFNGIHTDNKKYPDHQKRVY